MRGGQGDEPALDAEQFLGSTTQHCQIVGRSVGGFLQPARQRANAEEYAFDVMFVCLVQQGILVGGGVEFPKLLQQLPVIESPVQRLRTVSVVGQEHFQGAAIEMLDARDVAGTRIGAEPGGYLDRQRRRLWSPVKGRVISSHLDQPRDRLGRIALAVPRHAQVEQHFRHEGRRLPTQLRNKSFTHQHRTIQQCTGIRLRLPGLGHQPRH
ncbi:MAG: hypothetical protein IIC29_09735 [Chloroflexi bacterium]|nr:hypothetical protein [Chloroflexota bacterium]